MDNNSQNTKTKIIKPRIKSKSLNTCKSNKHSRNNNTNSNTKNLLKKSANLSNEVNMLFKPTLNKHSIEIAKALNTSFMARVLQKKRKCNCNQANQDQVSTLALSDYYTFIRNAETEREHNRKKNSIIPKRIYELYEENITKNKVENKRKRLLNAIQNNNSSSLLSDSHLNHHSSEIKTSRRNQQEFYFKNMKWKQQKDKRNFLNSVKKDKQTSNECTFSPDITPLDITNDEQIIQFNTPSINAYINKRRTIIKQQQEQKSYKQKVFFEQASFTSSYYHSLNKPVNSEFNSDKRIKGKTNRKSSVNATTDYINSMRNKLNIRHFFYDYSEQMQGGKV